MSLSSWSSPWSDENRVRVRYFLTAVLPITMLGAAAPGLDAQATTKVMVRVVAKDAKIIGSNVGGAHITVRDAESGAVLAEGVQEGSTGNTDLIMGDRPRAGTVFDTEGAAGFLAELDIREPTRVVIEGRGPLGTEHATQMAQKTLQLVPGVDLVGEGVVLELNGFTVEILAPTEGPVAAGESFDVRARVTMLCGCPTEPGGLWDSSDYELTARAVRGSEVVAEWPLEFAGTTSEYTATARLEAPGEFELQVIAIDRGKANVGIAVDPLIVR